jgi:PPOX class probable F420-dependent enzyme
MSDSLRPGRRPRIGQSTQVRQARHVGSSTHQVMPKPPLPAELDQFLTQPNPSVIATLDHDGSPHTAATWYLWEGGRVLVNMDESRKRLGHLRADPHVSITVLGQDSWYHHVTLRGRVVEFDEDGLDDIDRLSRHYTGQPYSDREHRRVSAWIEVESWHSWAVGRPWVP